MDVKISELIEADTMKAGCCFPIVQDGETKKVTYQTLIDQIFPVGFVYININNINPSNLFGGTWERIKDCFLLAAGDTYSGGSTGGEAEHTLTVGEMPNHRHELPIYNTSGATFPSSSRINYTEGATKGWLDNGIMQTKGNSEPHNNMPPYLTVYMWKRTA